MKKYFVILFGLIALSIGNAAVPQNFSLQGKLLGSDDKPVANGNYSITLNVYYNITSSNPDWSLDVSSVSIVNGLFSIVIDAGMAGKNGEMLDFSKPMYLGFQPKGEAELLPRQIIGSVPFALRTDQAAAASVSDTAKNVIGGTLPVGTVISYAGTLESIPPNFMLCDGSALSSKKYPELYKALGSSWGNGTDGDTTLSSDFNLPDLRGQFLRGVDNSGSFDMDASGRTALKTGGNSGNMVGTYQNDQSGISNDINQALGGIPSFDTSPQPTVNNFNSTYSNSGSLETRPKNASVYFIIKIK